MTRTIFTLLLFAALPAAAQTGFSFRDVNGTSLELSENGKPVFQYNYGMMLKDGFPEAMRRSTYLHPVYLPDGTVITDDFNADHPHHRGISWMWQNITVSGNTYDLWTIKGIKERFIRWTAREANKQGAKLAAENGWFVGDMKVVKENVEIVAQPVKNGARRLDFTLRFEALGAPVEILGTPDQKKGFGGFCFRFAPRDGGKEKTVIRTENGVNKADGIMEVHKWAQVEGVFHGAAGGGRIEDDPSNPNYPNNGWLLRHGFGFMNPSWPGNTPFKLVAGRPLVLRYHVTLYSGKVPVE